MKYQVQIRKHADDEIIETMTYDTQRLAERADMGVNRNLNHAEYYTDLVEVEEDEA